MDHRWDHLGLEYSGQLLMDLLVDLAITMLWGWRDECARGGNWREAKIRSGKLVGRGPVSAKGSEDDGGG